MSRRTSEASKVIAAAWNNEKQLVFEGKGTRDWTPEQQQEILDRGKAYDDNGKAFEGHHMKSVEKYPEYQGEPRNIQFLNRQEHQEAHDGNFQNPTNGYFDTITKITKDFGDNPYEPCEIIKLSEPKVVVANSNEIVEAEFESGSWEGSEVNSVKKSNGPPKTKTVTLVHKEGTVKKAVSQKSGFKKFIGGAVEFYERHQNIIKPVLEIGVPVVRGLILKNVKRGSSSKVESGNVSVSKPPMSVDTAKKIVNRVSPAENIVSGHRQRYNGVWKEKAPYPRGKKRKVVTLSRGQKISL